MNAEREEKQPNEVKKIPTGKRQERLLAQSVVLEEAGISRLLKIATVAVAGAILIFFIWANFANMEEVAHTTGEVATTDTIQFAQHLEGGIVGEIFIEEGQRVTQGQPLAQMKSEDVLAEYNQMHAREAILALQVAQKRALINSEPIDLSGIERPLFDHMIAESVDFLDAQRTSLASQREVILIQVKQKEMKLKKLLNQAQANRQQVQYYNEELEVRRPLTERKLMSRLQTLSAMQSREKTRADMLESEGDVEVTKLELDEKWQNLRETEDSFYQDAMRELDGAYSELTQIRTTLPRLRDRMTRLVVRSPVDGVIKEIKVNGVGSVLGPGGEIAEIVPLEDTNKVEVKITTVDIGHVAVGQDVTVKVSTYDYARYGGIQGKLIAVSPSTFVDENGKDPYYRGTIQLDQNYVGSDPTKNLLLPGMTVEASIHTGSKTLMEYLLKPIYASVNDSFRER
ncbi:type I secretion membrane fusion protein, HlyD family [Magnetococcus marinus MC-1]|uniref:Membrane fusion protein (MFP) family protein n=1 Tax=Magnetococcus marinus (strain ATCC BAA-1437 / JCM 17883 / MC-1) TaxID=156889 RepID=A0L5K8_MAGMM|nr:HlyD family type I secretion periplasmic adaptor subunit [Magnetococcus marinus]ABK43251.1 type I secretion membrane fusion protein, HlyD family [Magnetococcus marinus MC-1]